MSYKLIFHKIHLILIFLRNFYLKNHFFIILKNQNFLHFLIQNRIYKNIYLQNFTTYSMFEIMIKDNINQIYYDIPNLIYLNIMHLKY